MRLSPHSTSPWLAIALCATALQAQQPAVSTPPATLTASTDQPGVLATRPAAAEPESEIRIVRLSTVRGEVQLDRLTGHGFEPAFTNLPVIQGARLQTAMGVAEVEFEDNSTLRVAPNTLVEFTHLGLRRSGAKVSSVRVLKGTAFVSMSDTKDNDFTVAFNKNQIQMTPNSHVRLNVSDPDTRLAVLNGTIPVEDPAGNFTVGKKKTLLFDPAAASAPRPVSNAFDEGPLAKWDNDSVSYHKVAAYSAFGAGSNAYGSNDLNYYGSFANLGGSCGNAWRPYFASAAWDPFANGVWAYYPNAGYSWVSPYPWGWQPFHSGSWQYCGAGSGWGWQPGNGWNGLNNGNLVSSVKGPAVSGTVHPRPPLPPSQHGGTLVVVNTRPLSVSKFTSADQFTFHNDSAGLGVPREAFSRLDKMATGVARQGTVTTTVYNANQANVMQSHEGAPSVGNSHINNNPSLQHSPMGTMQSPSMSTHSAPATSSAGAGHSK